MTRVLVVGASEHAKVVLDILERSAGAQVVGVVDDQPVGADIGGVPVLGSIDDLPSLVAGQGVEATIVGIGDNWTRALVASRVHDLVPTLPFATAVHPSAQIGARTVIGAGSVLMAGVVVNNDGRVGEHTILNTRSSLDHDSVLDDFASLAPNVATGGKVRIGAYSAIGIGASILHGVAVGPQTVVGAGSVVFRDLPDHVVAYGTPARVVRPRSDGDRYL